MKNKILSVVLITLMLMTVFICCNMKSDNSVLEVNANNTVYESESSHKEENFESLNSKNEIVESVQTEEIQTEFTSIVSEEPKTDNLKMTFVGDLMVHEWQILGAYYSENDTYDFTLAFDMVKPILESADLTVGNLETTFGGAERGWKYYPTFNTPDEFGETLKDVGFDILTTVNNHCMDTGISGLERTIDILDKLGIVHMGTYKSQEARDEICIVEKNNMKFAFLSYTYGTNWIPVPEENSFAVNFLDIELMKADIAKAKELEPDFIIVMPHFGNEYELVQNAEQEKVVEELFNAGADIIIGSHAHVVQPMEKRIITDEDGNQRTGFVIYSMGNFISSQTTEPRDTSLILNFEFEKTEGEKAFIKEISFIPTWVQFRYIDNRYLIRTLPIYDTLELIENLDWSIFTQTEISRMNAAAQDTLKRIFKEDYVNEDLKEVYIFE